MARARTHKGSAHTSAADHRLRGRMGPLKIYVPTASYLRTYYISSNEYLRVMSRLAVENE